MKWTDTRDIAIALAESAPGRRSRDGALHRSARAGCCALPGFDDDPKHRGEKILEAIQMAWIDGGRRDESRHRCR